MIGKTLRIVNWAGPCIDHGVVVGETRMFWKIEPIGFERRARIFKSDPLVHLEPCTRCCDHPETNYPRGYEG
jgi:hypothetical protein